jgi:hypothetical protein
MSTIRAEPGAIYSCRDANGRTHSADRIISECVGQKIIVRNPDGSIKREIEPQLSGEARAKKEAEEQSKREEQLRLAEQRRRDNALMSMYPREEDIERSRQRSLALPQEIIRTAETRLNEAQNRHAQLNREAEGFKGKAVPKGLKRQIEDIANNIAREKNLIQDQHNDLIRINQRFDEDLKRYRALMQADSAAAKPSSAVLPAKTP